MNFASKKDHSIAEGNASSATMDATCSCSSQLSSVEPCMNEQGLSPVSQLLDDGKVENTSLFCMAPLTVALSIFGLLVFVQRRRRRLKKNSSTGPAAAATLERKRDFISRSVDAYGYRLCESGHIDTWRPQELPSLIPPVESTNQHSTTVSTEYEVYLDYAGAALPTKTMLSKIISQDAILANPHSTGPAASRTSLLIEQAKARVMNHFDCHPGRLAGLAKKPQSCDPIDCHPGYDVVWTCGATESLRIVAEHFPWSACDECENQSTLVYSQNSHTSVVGMRGPALAKGASFQCHPLSDICTADAETIEHWSGRTGTQCSCCCGNTASNLLVFPLQCNFGGDKANATNVIQTCRDEGGGQWFTMLDLAKAASTEQINLKALDPDFACISFYKLFGEPTGLGALFVKRTSVNLLADQTEVCALHRYFGGGSVDAVMSGIDFAVGRTGPLASLSNGSVHFRGIASLCHGFDELDRLGGMERIRAHTTVLSAELVRRLKALRHGNGQPAIVLYGAWSKIDDTDMDNSLLPGPTIAFNVLRDDGSFVGYNEVSKLAGLNRPPLQLRTGCFCNPGACQEALQLSDEEVQSNYLTSNHVCGDHIDIIDDKPTGAIRASFGKHSMWEDLDALVMFLAKNFVNERVQLSTTRLVPSVSEVQLSEMYIFPIKSCSTQRVSRWMVIKESAQLAFDREFALVDSSGTAMRLQNYPRMSLLKPTIDLESRTMTVRAPGYSDLLILLDDDCSVMGEQNSVIKVCGNKCGGRLWGDLATSDWFSSFLGVRCWLARHVGGRYELSGSRGGVAFANEAPLLLLSQHSVDTLNEVLVSQGQRHVNSRHFRPNLVVRSTAPGSSGNAASMLNNPEDRWTKLSLVGRKNKLELNVVGQCARCSMVDVDPATGKKQKTLRALADYRRRNGQITFGVFLQAETSQEKDVCSTVWLEEGDIMKCT